MIERSQIVAEAQTWIGTPFQHAQSCKGFGADCVGLCIGVFKALGCVDAAWFPKPYSQQWHVHQNQEALIESVQTFGFKERFDAPEPGDLLFFQFGRVCSHVGLYVGDGQMIHAFFSLKRAVKQPLDGDMAARLRHVYVAPWVS